MLISLQNGKCSLIFTTYLVNTTKAAIVNKKQFLFFSQFSRPLFHPYLFSKSSLQSTLTLPSYITQQFFTSLFLRANIPTIYTKNIFPTSNIFPIQAASRDQGLRESCEDWQCFNLSVFSQSMDSDKRAYSQSLILYRSDSKNWYIAEPSNPPSLILSIYFHYYDIQLTPP